jgi:hypothetical protein
LEIRIAQQPSWNRAKGGTKGQNSAEAKMKPTFDIFTDSPGAQPEWIESAEDLEDAKERLREVACIAPRRDCFIYSKDGGIVEVILRADFHGLRRAYSLTYRHNIFQELIISAS